MNLFEPRHSASKTGHENVQDGTSLPYPVIARLPLIVNRLAIQKNSPVARQ